MTGDALAGSAEMGAMQNAHEPHTMRQQLGRHCLEGLSIAGAFGQTFFHREAEAAIAARRLPEAPWLWTDDTHMAMSVVEVLGQHGCIDRDALASAFARRHTEDPMRGYGAGARRILQAIAAGTPWQQAAGSAFDGCGSMGNGAAITNAAAAAVLGNGAEVLAPDTVPFALWCAARHLDDYEAAIWSTVAGLGDRDTTCAIVGSIVVMRAGPTSIPASWRAAREPLGNGFEPAG